MILSPLALFQLRQQAIESALATATEGEDYAVVLARAEAYVAYVVKPLGDEMSRALVERAGATVH
jgi:RecJ-like exonuclease